MKLNDTSIYPALPIPTTPAAGKTFADPSFNTTILRVTDDKDGPGFCPQYSAIYDMFNADSSRIVFKNTVDGSLWVADLDVKARSVKNKARLGREGAAYWSRKDPNALYVVELWNSGKIWKKDFGAGQWSVVADISILVPAVMKLDTNWLDSRGMSWDDNRFHFSSANADIVGIYDVAQKKVLGPVSLAQARTVYPALTPYDWGKTTMDGAGKAVAIATGPLLVFNIEQGIGAMTGFGTASNQYGDVHPDAGPNNLIANCGGLPVPGPNDGFYPQIVTLDPANLSTYVSQRRRIGPRAPWGIDVHCSFRDGLWNTITYDDGAPTEADAGKPFPFIGEIVQFGLNSPPDGSVNRRVVKHYANPSVFTDSGQRYWAAPRGCTSQDGRCVGFNSTYANGRIDVYVAFVDDGPAPPPPAPAGDTLAGVQFSPAEAQALKSWAQWVLAKK